MMKLFEQEHDEVENQNTIAAAALVDRFDSMPMIPDRNPAVEDFEPVLGKESFRGHLFERSKDAFLLVLDGEKVKKYLSDPEPTKEAFKYLKRVRRFGLILRANYKFSDFAHMSPEGLHRFLRLLGDYNDRYGSSEKQDASPLRESLNGVRPTEFAFDGASDRDFEDYTKKTLNSIRARLRETELPAGEFHELRKSIRLFADLMQVAAAENYGGDMHWLFASILSLSRRLGEQHDDIVQRSLNKEIDYQGAVVRIEPEVRQEFSKLEPYIEKVTGIS